MILGIGVDIIEVNRIRNSFEKFGDRFVKRILHDAEIEYCLSHRAPGRSWLHGSPRKRRSRRLLAQALARNSAGRTWKSAARKPANLT